MSRSSIRSSAVPGIASKATNAATRTRPTLLVDDEGYRLELFGGSLGPADEVAMDATGSAMEIARIITPHVARVVVANAQELRAISHARVKPDRSAARTLADHLVAGMLAPVWIPDGETQVLRRRVARRATLVRQRTRAKNENHATPARRLLGRSSQASSAKKRRV
jgi:transposase